MERCWGGERWLAVRSWKDTIVDKGIFVGDSDSTRHECRDGATVPTCCTERRVGYVNLQSGARKKRITCECNAMQ